MMDLHTVSHEVRMLLVALNWAFCTAVGWVCVCRFSQMSKPTTRLRFRVGYFFLFMAATLSGFSWLWFGEWPGPGQIGMAAGILVRLFASADNWKHGTPSYARTAPDDFDDLPHHHWPAAAGGTKEPPCV